MNRVSGEHFRLQAADDIAGILAALPDDLKHDAVGAVTAFCEVFGDMRRVQPRAQQVDQGGTKT